MSSTKHVQTEIDESLYSMLKALSLREGKPIKEILREAIEEYLRRNAGITEEEVERDPIWKAFGVVELKGKKTSHDEDWGVVEWRSH